MDFRYATHSIPGEFALVKINEKEGIILVAPSADLKQFIVLESNNKDVTEIVEIDVKDLEILAVEHEGARVLVNFAGGKALTMTRTEGDVLEFDLYNDRGTLEQSARYTYR